MERLVLLVPLLGIEPNCRQLAKFKINKATQNSRTLSKSQQILLSNDFRNFAGRDFAECKLPDTYYSDDYNISVMILIHNVGGEYAIHWLW